MYKNLIDIQKILGENNILTCFSGRFSQGLIEEMGEAVKNHMESDNKPKNEIFNAFSIFIEQTQNIKNYTASKEGISVYSEIAVSSIVCIGKSQEGYFIWSGNLMENHDVQPLNERLDIISKASKDELKILYKDQMKKEIESTKNSAGIGLINIARKSRVPIEFSFDKINDSFSFYELKVSI